MYRFRKNLLLIMLCVYSSIFSMKQPENISNETVREYFYKTIIDGDDFLALFKEYLKKYPGLINYCRDLLKITYDSHSLGHIAFLLERGVCTNKKIFSGRIFIEELLRDSYCNIPYPILALFANNIIRLCLSSGCLCGKTCNHTRGEKPFEKHPLDLAFYSAVSTKFWSDGIEIALHATDEKEEYIKKYNAVLEAFPSIHQTTKQVPETKFIHALILGTAIPLDHFKYGMVSPAAAREFEKLLTILDLETIDNTLTQEHIEDALVTRNKYGLHALLKKLPLLNPDKNTQNILTKFHQALETHKKIWHPFAKEVEIMEKVEKNRQECFDLKKLYKIRDVYFNFKK